MSAGTGTALFAERPIDQLFDFDPLDQLRQVLGLDELWIRNGLARDPDHLCGRLGGLYCMVRLWDRSETAVISSSRILAQRLGTDPSI
jgi:hypothetical protein